MNDRTFEGALCKYPSVNATRFINIESRVGTPETARRRSVNFVKLRWFEWNDFFGIERQIAQQTLQNAKRPTMRNNQHAARFAFNLIGELLQPVRYVFKTLTVGRPKADRILASECQRPRIFLLDPLGIVPFPIAEIDFAQGRLDSALEIGRDDIGGFNAAAHRARITARESIRAQGLRQRFHLAPPLVVEREIRSPQKAPLRVVVGNAVPCENDHTIDDVMTASVMP